MKNRTIEERAIIGLIRSSCSEKMSSHSSRLGRLVNIAPRATN